MCVWDTFLAVKSTSCFPRYCDDGVGICVQYFYHPQFFFCCGSPTALARTIHYPQIEERKPDFRLLEKKAVEPKDCGMGHLGASHIPCICAFVLFL